MTRQNVTFHIEYVSHTFRIECGGSNCGRDQRDLEPFLVEVYLRNGEGYAVEGRPLVPYAPQTKWLALVTTGDHDDRVVPGHSMKFAAALQAAQGCANPALIRIEISGSHGYRPTDKAIAEAADVWAFADTFTSRNPVP